MAPRRTILSFSCSIAAKVCAVVGPALALASLAAPARACSIPSFDHILLGAVPPVAEDSKIIAKVEIIDVYRRQAVTVARARVLQSIRGVADGQIVEIYAEGSSCGGGLSREDVWRQGFIAGRYYNFTIGLLFGGSWRQSTVGDHFPDLRAPDTRPWWRMPWSWFYSPWYLRGALMVLFLYLLWRVAGWLDRRQAKRDESA
jgi:hypothetical protein